MTDLLNYSFPDDLKTMTNSQLEMLSCDIRKFLIETVSKTGGHLASNLGIVELAIGLHKVFDSPKDKIVWDVGHQSYVHKILTGRADKFNKLRQTGGISGFPKAAESPHDIFDTGHSSNSVSLAAGLAAARDLKNENYNVIAVIGDGALTGGMAYEGLNNLGFMKSKSIVILNDNGMSISKNTGSISMHLNKLRVSTNYLNAKENVKKALNKVPVVGKGLTHRVSHIKNSLKYALVDGGAIFEAFGFTYIGPIDGNNIEKVIETLEIAKESAEPILIHAITTKGKGYKQAEEMPNKFHGIGPFDADTGITAAAGESFSSVFGKKLVNIALEDKRITAVCAAMADGTGLSIFSETFPERTFDVGIAEEHAVSFAAGLAKNGLKPVVAIYSTFLQRAYDQIMMDVALQNLPVIFAVDRSGNVGADGETHHGTFDISYLSQIPNMTVLAPKDYAELELMLEYAVNLSGPCAIRFPRGRQYEFPCEFSSLPIEAGKAQVFFTGMDVELWACGKMTGTAVEVLKILDGRGFKTGLVNARFIKPFDKTGLIESARRTKLIVTLEDNVLAGGFGSQVASFFAGGDTNVYSFGWPDKFIEHGSSDDLFKKYGLDAQSIAERIIEIIENKKRTTRCTFS